MKPVKLIPCLFALLLPQWGLAAPVSLEEAIRDALDHAPALQSAMAARNSAREDRLLGRAWLLPYVVTSGSWKSMQQDVVYDRPIALLPLANEMNMKQQKYGIKMYQPLFDVEKWSYYEQGKASEAMGEAAFRRSERQTMLAAAAAWLDVMRAHDRLNAARASEQAMTRLAEQAKASFDVGLEPVNTSLAAASRRDLASAQRIRAEQALEQSRAVLSSLLGHDADVAANATPQLVPLKMKPQQEWLQQVDHADQVQLAERSVDLAEAGKLKAIGAALPKVQFVAGWDREKSSSGTFGTGSHTQTGYFGVEMTMPLYAGGSTWAQQRKSEQEKIKAAADLDEAKRSTQLAIRQAWLQWQGTGYEMDAMKAALTSANAEQEAARAGFEVGLRTMTEVLDAEERLASARAGYADSVASQGMAALQLYAAVGELGERQVSEVQGWLTGSVH
ncbi:type I secretion protein TolC [Mariprofundus erugo]|uniref:Type I secretion protein TolC n=1 Tax=Mariprofundus erugo TaxID=2528639 RepID=A0A5R9GV27_9PROT|nr:TolC family protein [Mariprofundus erugo]TLS67882.1 type I secretion protein TolC [Mariprofundus erugo]